MEITQNVAVVLSPGFSMTVTMKWYHDKSVPVSPVRRDQEV